MAVIGGDLWTANMVKVVVVDVSDDYLLMQPPLPSHCYPILAEVWLPRWNLQSTLSERTLVDGYLYDWHEAPKNGEEVWFVGVVDEFMLGPRDSMNTEPVCPAHFTVSMPNAQGL